MFLKPSKNQEL